MTKLENVLSPEKGWAITAKILIGFIISRAVKTSSSLLGKGEHFTLLVTGWEKYEEILQNVYGDIGKQLCHYVKETINTPVEDAVTAAKLYRTAWTLLSGPDFEYEIVQASPEEAVVRINNCPWLQRFEEFEIGPEHRACHRSHQANGEKGLMVFNPMLTFKLTKAPQWGDSYCEFIIGLKDF